MTLCPPPLGTKLGNIEEFSMPSVSLEKGGVNLPGAVEGFARFLLRTSANLLLLALFLALTHLHARCLAFAKHHSTPPQVEFGEG